MEHLRQLSHDKIASAQPFHPVDKDKQIGLRLAD